MSSPSLCIFPFSFSCFQLITRLWASSSQRKLAVGQLKLILCSAAGATGRERRCLKAVSLEEREPGKPRRGRILWLLRIEEICRSAPWGASKRHRGRTVRYSLGKLPLATGAPILEQSAVLQAHLGSRGAYGLWGRTSQQYQAWQLT